MTVRAPLGWGGIARLGLVQSSLGAIVMLASSLLNRIMVVELAFLVGLRHDLKQQIEERSGPVARRDLKPSGI